MTEITATPGEESDQEKFNFSNPEDIIFWVITDSGSEAFHWGDPSWKDHSIECASILRARDEGTSGVCSYEQSYGCGIEYMIESHIVCPGPGWWVIEEITGHFSKGEWGFTDDNMDFYVPETARPATPDEIAQA
jgi:hypothetical protein